jgi:hypothetical protein
MSEKVVFRSRRDPKAPVSTEDLDLAIKAALYQLDPSEVAGPEGPQGDSGEQGEPGDPGAKRFLELEDVPESYEDQAGKVVRVNRAETAMEFVDPPTRLLSIGGGGGTGPAGPPGPEGPPGTSHEHVPKSAVLTRDSNGSVESVTVEGQSTWTISRNPDGSVAGLTDGTHDVAVDRDPAGIVTGVTATEL